MTSLDLDQNEHLGMQVRFISYIQVCYEESDKKERYRQTLAIGVRDAFIPECALGIYS